MDENAYLSKVIFQQLNAGKPLVLVSVINLEGSTPRHNGTKMAIDSEGKTYGTIGGSLIEAAAINESKAVIQSRQSRIFSFELTGKDSSSPGMICGGKAEILLDYLSPSPENQAFSQQWHDASKLGKDLYLLTYLKDKGGALQECAHAVFIPDDETSPDSTFRIPGIEKLKPEFHNISTTSILALDDSRVMVDRIRKLKTLYCFGAGHVAVPTAHLAALVGFKVIVLDDRAEYANAERFPEADRITVVEDFNHALNGLEIDEDSYIVIVTRGHQYDRSVLEQSLKTPAGYIGMISSKRKRAAIYEALMADGFTKDRLDWVHSPIGLDIGAETPEEIAVSIVAELIQVRSKQSK